MAQLPPLIQFSAGSPAIAQEVNDNFTDIRNHINGANIGTENLASALLSRSGSPILSLTQLTENQIAFNVENSQSNTAVSIAQLASLAVGKSILKISETVAQTLGTAQLHLSLQSGSTIPAVLVQHSGIDTLKLTRDYLRLEVLLKPPVKTTVQRNALVSPETGSLLYDSTTQQLNEKRNGGWAPVGCPVGTVIMYAGASAPEGWLICNGDTVPTGSGTLQGVTADFSALYAVVSSVAAWSGKLPDLRGMFVRGAGTHGSAIGGFTPTGTLGTEQGDATAVNGLNATQPPHSHNGVFRVTTSDPSSDGGSGWREINYDYNNTTSTAQPSITVASTDTETRPVNVALTYIIKY